MKKPAAAAKTTDLFVKDASKRIWSHQQEEIFSWFRTGTGNLIVRARAGCGKSSTILEAVNHAPEKHILLAAFNKSIATELAARLQPGTPVEAKTLHSVGFGFILSHWKGVRPDADRAGRLATKALDSLHTFSAPFTVVGMVAKLATLGKEMQPYASVKPVAKSDTNEGSDGDLSEIAAAFDCVADAEMESLGWTSEMIEIAALKAMELATEHDGTIDFADMLYLPLKLNLVHGKWDLVCIDEAQDMSYSQILLAQRACKAGGRIALIGDDRQCHPAGALVEMTGGQRLPVEQLKKDQMVVSYHEVFRGLRYQGRLVEDVSSRPYKGPLVEISAESETTRVTPNHRIPTRLRTGSGYALYAMEYGNTSKLGCCQLMYKNAFGPSMRLRHERADRVWVLAVYDSKEEAQIAETIASLKFGLPEQIFFEKGAFKQKLLNAIGDNRAKLVSCLQSHYREYDYPIFSKQASTHLGRKCFVTQACNLLDGWNEVRTFDGSQGGGAWAPVNISRSHYEGPVYSISVAPTEGGLRLYVADRILVHNSIYGFRGADSGSLDRMKVELNAHELGLTTTYRCPKLVVGLAQKLVPDFNAAPEAPEGVISTLQIESLSQHVQPGDYVVSRLNAPLVGVCLSLLRAGIRAKVQGRDIGKGLVTLVKKFKAFSLVDLLKKLQKWEENEVAKAVASKRKGRAQTLRDQAETLRHLCSGLTTVRELESRIYELFADVAGEDLVVCSTVHKIKGRESDQVFILKDTLYPFDRSQEEQNIEYVAISRTKRSLVWVIGKM